MTNRKPKYLTLSHTQIHLQALQPKPSPVMQKRAPSTMASPTNLSNPSQISKNEDELMFELIEKQRETNNELRKQIEQQKWRHRKRMERMDLRIREMGEEYEGYQKEIGQIERQMNLLGI